MRHGLHLVGWKAPESAANDKSLAPCTLSKVGINKVDTTTHPTATWLSSCLKYLDDHGFPSLCEFGCGCVSRQRQSGHSLRVMLNDTQCCVKYEVCSHAQGRRERCRFSRQCQCQAQWQCQCHVYQPFNYFHHCYLKMHACIYLAGSRRQLCCSAVAMVLCSCHDAALLP